MDLLDTDDFSPEPNLQPETVADVVHEYFDADRAVQDWPALWRRINAPLAAFLARLETETRVPALTFATLRHLQKKMLLAAPDDGPVMLASAYRVNLELTRPVRDVFLPDKVDRIICRLTFKGKSFGSVEIPGIGAVTGRKIAKLALERRRRLVVRLWLRSMLPPGRGFYVGLATICALLRLRILKLLWTVLTARPEDRLIAAKQFTRDVAGAMGSGLLRILAARPGLAVRRFHRQWQKYLDTTAISGRAYARKQIDAASLNDQNRSLASPNGVDPRTPAIKGPPGGPTDRQ